MEWFISCEGNIARVKPKKNNDRAMRDEAIHSYVLSEEHACSLLVQKHTVIFKTDGVL